MPVTSIVEAKEVIRVCKSKFDLDLTAFTLLSLRYKLDKTISLHFLRYPDVLCARLMEDIDFMDEFLYDISSPSTEMFRDTECWKTIRNQLLPELNKLSSPVAWLPGTTSGNELYSFLILLENSGFIKPFDVHASSWSQKSIEVIKSGWFDNKNLEQSLENFNNIFPGHDFRKYLEFKNHTFYRITKIVDHVKFSIHDLYFQPPPQRINLIIFRNKFLSFTGEFQNRVLDLFIEILEPGGFLVTGYQENVAEYMTRKSNMTFFNEEERIFRKT